MKSTSLVIANEKGSSPSIRPNKAFLSMKGKNKVKELNVYVLGENAMLDRYKSNFP